MVLHPPHTGAAADVRTLTQEKLVHSTLSSRAAPGFAQSASSAPAPATVLALDASLQSRTSFLACRREITRPLPCPVQLLKREIAAEKLPQKGLC